MKEMITEALKEANEDNTWVTNVRDYREINELLEGAVERIEQLEKAMEEAIEESRWGDAENSLGKVNRILTAALEKE